MGPSPPRPTPDYVRGFGKIKKGDIKEAQWLLVDIESDYYGRIVENRIWHAWYATGDMSEERPSIDYHDLLDDDEKDFAISVMRAGSSKIALQRARHDSTDNALFKLANICLEAGNQNTFNEIIPMALKDMSSACKIAGLLCKKYPAYARDIFKILYSNI